MAKTKMERIASIDEEITQLKNRQKLLQQQYNVQERKERTHRLCKRGGLWESLLPDTITLTDEQFKVFIEKTLLTSFAQKILGELKMQSVKSIAPQRREVAAAQSESAVQNDSASGSLDGGDGEGRRLAPPPLV